MPELDLTYLLIGHVATHSRACHARMMTAPADEQASEKRSSARTGGREERCRRPASECGVSIGYACGLGVAETAHRP
eukprot:6213157-Pleurochrysis_carterae.AAC.1